MIQNLMFVTFFLKILFPQVQWTLSVFFIPEFVAENLKANKNQQKRSLILQYSFTQKTSFNLRISTLLKLKILCSQSTAKKKRIFVEKRALPVFKYFNYLPSYQKSEKLMSHS